MVNTAISTSYETDHYHAAFEHGYWHAGQSLARVLAEAGYDVKISLHAQQKELVIEWPVLKTSGKSNLRVVTGVESQEKLLKEP